jgi:hypothetical protein
MADYGFRGADLAPLTVAIAKRLISLGGAVVLGHQWRPQGIMDSIVRFTQIYRSESGSPKEPIVYNLLAAPNVAQISLRDREGLKSILNIEEAISAPDAINERDRQVARRLHLRQMRLKMAQLCDVRICVGGKLIQKHNRTHGVIEEAALAVENKRPVFLCGLLKGSTGLLIDLLRGNVTVNEAVDLLSAHESANDQTPCNQFTSDYLKKIAATGREEVARRAGLQSEQDALFDAQSIDAMITLVARALVRTHVRRE